MPNYPKYDSHHSPQLATELQTMMSVTTLFRNDTQDGREIRAWFQDENWFDKTIEYFTPTESDARAGNGLVDNKNAIRTRLLALKASCERLAVLGNPDFQPETASQRWEETMLNISVAAERLSEELMSYNTLTNNGNISDPAVKAAFAAARGARNMYARMERARDNEVLQQLRTLTSDDEDSYDARKNALTNEIKQFSSSCAQHNVIAGKLSPFMEMAEKTRNNVADRIVKYQETADWLDKQNALEHDKVERVKAQMTKENAFDKLYEGFLTMKHYEALMNGEKEAPAEIDYEELEAAKAQKVKVEKIIAGMKIPGHSNRALLEEFLEATGGEFVYNGELLTPEDNQQERAIALRELSRNDEALIESFETYLTDYIDSVIDDMEKDAQSLGAEEKLTDHELRQKFAESKSYYDEQEANYLQTHTAKSSVGDIDSFEYNSSTVLSELAALRKRIKERDDRLEEMADITSTNPELYNERQELSRKLRNVAENFHFKQLDVEHNYVEPLNVLKQSGNELEKKVRDYNKLCTELKRDAVDLKDNRVRANNSSNRNAQNDDIVIEEVDRAAAMRAKMAELGRKLGKNKRLFHMDSDAFKHMKDMVERYGRGDANVTMAQVKAAADEYLNAKESQRYNANSKMRNYRKALAAMISDEAGNYSERESFLLQNKTELDQRTDTLQVKSVSEINYKLELEKVQLANNVAKNLFVTQMKNDFIDLNNELNSVEDAIKDFDLKHMSPEEKADIKQSDAKLKEDLVAEYKEDEKKPEAPRKESRQLGGKSLT